MIYIKRFFLQIIVAFLPAFIVAQDNNTEFKYELLSEEKNVNEKFIDNYNNAILHYNKAINLIKSHHPDLSLDKLEKIQQESLAEFKRALPFFEIAYKIEPKNENVLKGLSGSYLAINDKERSDKYGIELEVSRKK